MRPINCSAAAEPASQLAAAIGNIGLEDELDILASSRSLQPDLVIVAYYLNDARPSERVLWQPGTNWLTRRSLLLQAGLNLESLISLTLDFRVPFRLLKPREWMLPPAELDWRNRREDLLALANVVSHDWGDAWNEAHAAAIAVRSRCDIRRAGQAASGANDSQGRSPPRHAGNDGRALPGNVMAVEFGE